jgi:SNF2 family DNA or RNA helicase
MGLGKTVQMLKAMVENKKSKTLVVVPKSLISQWDSEVKRFTKFSVEKFEGTNRKLIGSEVCIACYSILDDPQLCDVKWDRVILDEAHFIRNPNTKVFKACIKIRAGIRWVVTGTPIFNNIKDFITLSKFVGISAGDIQRDYDRIRSDFVIRRTKADMRVKMVPCTFENVELIMGEEEKTLYAEVYEDFCDKIKFGANMMDILETFLRCRQICVWPQLYYDGLTRKGIEDAGKWKLDTTVKLDYLINSIRTHPTEKTLVFTQFTGESRKIKSMLETDGTHVFILDGSTVNREDVIESFKNAPTPAVFVIQIKTGGVGLNLQEASRVYITHPAWNPATEMQAIARSHRNGQTKVVHVKKLLYVHDTSIETEIVELQNAKAYVCAKILNDPSLAVQIPKVQTVSKFIFKIGKRLRITDHEKSPPPSH